MKLTSLLNEKMVLKNYDEYVKLVAKAYDEAVEYDDSAVKHWKSLNASNYTLFRRLLSRVQIIFISEDTSNDGKKLNVDGKTYTIQHHEGEPYSSQSEMRKDWKDTKTLKISIDYSDHPVFSVSDNVVFRCVHDFIVHIQNNHPFGAKGEIASYNAHAKLVPKDALPAIFTEIVGQASFVVDRGYFPTQKVVVLDGFDFVNVGMVSGYDVKDKTLVQKS